jgi:hypothetical protein
MMKHPQPTLLGKKATLSVIRTKPSSKFHVSWILFIAGPLAVLGSWAYLGLQPSAHPAAVRTVAVSQTTRLLADSPAAAPAGKTAKDYCKPDFVRKYYDPKTLFPLLPPEVLGDTKPADITFVPVAPPLPYTNNFFTDTVRDTGSKTGTTDEPECSPAYWNRNILILIAWKVLYLLYWMAGILAVIITVYAGLLFISGFASEENTKTAKKLLVACYTGIVIIILGRVILYGTIQPFLGNDLNAGDILIPNGLLKN